MTDKKELAQKLRERCPDLDNAQNWVEFCFEVGGPKEKWVKRASFDYAHKVRDKYVEATWDICEPYVWTKLHRLL